MPVAFAVTLAVGVCELDHDGHVARNVEDATICAKRLAFVAALRPI
jgi:hypothetical protein